ncbi:MAG: sigma-70 family RNA polymerase sigma factor [Planctomycetes bacterium]|nr:sigma-70 family RNA polymerase sigma factor [Planctomycetota bacterium]NOG54921.1 sigma-70 family RNA polymerase sigma factor [Planctomycetota bacterium]
MCKTQRQTDPRTERTPHMHPLADQILIQRYHSGDREALERLLQRWNTEVLSLAYRLTANREDALDIRQQTFLKVYNALPAFRAESRFSTWLYRIVVNTCRDHLRSSETRDRAHDDALTPGAAVERTAPSQHDLCEQREAYRLVAHSIMALPAVEREIIVLRHYQQMPFTEIAVVVGSPVTTVKSRMMRALKRLRHDLATLTQDADDRAAGPGAAPGYKDDPHAMR